MKQKIASLFMIVLALVLLIPGITLPVLTLEGHIEKSQLAQAGIEMLAEDGNSRSRGMLQMVSGMLGLDQLEGQVLVYQKTRSIWGTVNELKANNNLLVACLVALFAVIVPVIKLLSQLLYSLLHPCKFKRLVGRFTQLVSKWSMADVFVIALIVTYLAGNADGQMGELLIMKAELGAGFWYFVGYCLCAILSGYFVSRSHKEKDV
ncbi:paraquat-inducible protein A [Pseudoalteromonas tunicata]|uniref:Paraquat-inducible protein A n=1 Tax=Pseudoalteromonas tunicata D2 TaxID=87626 RepID=A4C7R8_9GAMM|nr:paraquat-inducible protein A [Pseudoalteromonas tunicata]ATC93138.1 hypothetical protein PTUN_a0327 [Pseudoalteromonas tunicata]AXT32210.1 paraquat-inducible protein A [Pseudoalteromonas tunicata]EAR28633.1 hypothetical protein PTD2_06314 [Pseudoalteromonas tunicata D2]